MKFNNIQKLIQFYCLTLLFSVIAGFGGCRNKDFDGKELSVIDPNRLIIDKSSIIANGSFDEPNPLNRWQWNKIYNDAIKIEPRGMQATNAVVFELSKSKNACLQQKTTKNRSYDYVFYECYLRAENAKSNVEMRLECINNKIQYKNGREIYGVLEQQSLVIDLSGTTDWVKKYLIIAIPENTVELCCSLGVTGEQGCVIIDNINAYPCHFQKSERK